MWRNISLLEGYSDGKAVDDYISNEVDGEFLDNNNYVMNDDSDNDSDSDSDSDDVEEEEEEEEDMHQGQ